MSFTADIYKEILSDVTAETKRTFPFAMRMVKFNNGIMVVFAVNIATRMRSAFLSVASEASKNRFPVGKVSKLIRLLCRPMGLIHLLLCSLSFPIALVIFLKLWLRIYGTS